jgi:signal transduction histidine kinase/ActR/RegA family two-component response regulator
MHIFKNKILNTIANFGVTDSMRNTAAKKVIQMNILSIITFLSFHVFYIVLFFTSNGSKQKIFISYAIILFIALLSFLLAYTQKIVITKILFMGNAFLGVFFFDVYLGSSVSMGVYYFPFLFVTIKIFSFKKERLLLILFILLPLLLNILSGTFLKGHYDTHILTSQNIRNLRTFNFTFAFFLVVMYANYIINYEISTDNFIENSRLSLQSLIDNTNGSLWSIDNNFEIIAANKLFVSTIKQSLDVEIEAGYDFKKVMYSSNFPKEWLAFFEKSLSGNRSTEEYSLNGIVHEIQIAPILKDNIVMGAVFHDIDINVRKEYEKNIDLANTELKKAVKSKEQFLSNMSHELRTPLNGIIGISNILLAEKRLDSQMENLEMLKYSSDHMLDIVNDILDYNKIDAKKVELESAAFDISELLNKIGIFFNQEAIKKEIKLVLNFESVSGLVVMGDALRLRQILNNLISNAIKFTNKGTVCINVEKIKENNDGTIKIKFSITDTGIGIPSNKLDIIFSSFGQADNRITTKFGGTGLGLTISARLVELMESKIDVESTHGKGSTFSFELYVKKANNENVSQITSGVLQSFNGITALVAEDNKVNLLVIKRFLKSWGIETASAENGAIALEMARAKKYDLILMDLNMPVMDGKKASLSIREFDTNIPIIAITASTGENFKEELLTFGINDYIPKPFVPDVLHAVITRTMALQTTILTEVYTKLF